jgi:uncharacterized SAM-dependent methyltransferase
MSTYRNFFRPPQGGNSPVFVWRRGFDIARAECAARPANHLRCGRLPDALRGLKSQPTYSVQIFLRPWLASVRTDLRDAEYYTVSSSRCSIGLLRDCLDRTRAEILEFGAGAGENPPHLNALARPRPICPSTFPVLSEGHRGAAEKRIPALAIRPIVADFTRSRHAGFIDRAPRGILPRSTIGNFDRKASVSGRMPNCSRRRASGRRDLVKDPNVLHAAYNDRAGVTAAFNKNLLARANREAGANFDSERFTHYAFYNPLLRRIEVYLVSMAAQRVTVCGRSIAFAEGEAIHTEWSYKYTVEDFRALAASAGFSPRAVWCDPDRLFSVHWLESP